MISLVQYVYIYALTVPVFFAIDMTWLVVVAREFYKNHLGYLLSDSPVWSVAIAFYLLFIVGLLIFAVIPAIEARSLMHAVIFGALFGFFTYATYDLTNWSTVKDWPALVSLVDILWGTALSAIVASASYAIAVNFVLR